MQIIEAFGRIFISALFIIEASRKLLFKEETIFYMEDYGVPEILFYPSLIIELVFPIFSTLELEIHHFAPQIRILCKTTPPGTAPEVWKSEIRPLIYSKTVNNRTRGGLKTSTIGNTIGKTIKYHRKTNKNVEKQKKTKKTMEKHELSLCLARFCNFLVLFPHKSVRP